MYNKCNLISFIIWIYKDGQPLHHSLCSSYNWTNSTVTVDKVESLVIAYFTMDDEDFLVAFAPVVVDIIPPSNVWYWVISIFFVLVAILIYGTYLIYKEVKKKVIENEKIEEKEELD